MTRLRQVPRNHLLVPGDRGYAVESMPATRITWRDVLEMPEDGNRYEAIGGELYVSPPPKNGTSG